MRIIFQNNALTCARTESQLPLVTLSRSFTMALEQKVTLSPEQAQTRLHREQGHKGTKLPEEMTQEA
jgi:hypothetical protein